MLITTGDLTVSRDSRPRATRAPAPNLSAATLLELDTQENGERLFGREGDAVCLPGVPAHLGDLVCLPACSNAVAAVAAEGLLGGHLPGDTASCG